MECFLLILPGFFFRPADKSLQKSSLMYTFLSARISGTGTALNLKVVPFERASPITPSPVLRGPRPRPHPLATSQKWCNKRVLPSPIPAVLTEKFRSHPPSNLCPGQGSGIRPPYCTSSTVNHTSQAPFRHAPPTTLRCESKHRRAGCPTSHPHITSPLLSPA